MTDVDLRIHNTGSRPVWIPICTTCRCDLYADKSAQYDTEAESDAAAREHQVDVTNRGDAHLLSRPASTDRVTSLSTVSGSETLADGVTREEPDPETACGSTRFFASAAFLPSQNLKASTKTIDAKTSLGGDIESVEPLERELDCL